MHITAPQMALQRIEKWNPLHMKNEIRGLSLSVLALLAAGSLVKADTPSGAPMIPDLPWEKRSDWIDVKTDVTPAAKGDGIADDTDALQAGFKAMKQGSVLYIPAGTYRITRTLLLGNEQNHGGLANAAIIGHGRSTKIVWDGDADASMIKELGYTHSNFIGFQLDGRGKAGTGVQHSSFMFGTNMRYQHVAFLNLTGNGVSVGLPRHKAYDRFEGLETAETIFDNCLFENCFRGMYIGEYNDYDFVFNGCEFRNCGYGIVNNYGCHYVRNCHFERSKIADIQEHGCHGSAIWRCSSYGSGLFLDYSTPTAPYTMQDCNVDAWCDRRGAVLLNGAPIAIADCIIGNASTSLIPEDLRDGTPLWSVKIICKEAQRVILSDSTFSFKGKPTPLTRKDLLGDCALGFDTGRVYDIPAGERSGCLIKSARQSFLKTSVPMPGKIFDAKRDFGAKGDGKTSDTEAVQKTIDAARAEGKGTMAYLPAGHYTITKTLEIGGSNWSLAGAAVAATELNWSGKEGETLMHVSDPDHVTIENLAIGQNPNSKNEEDILQTSTGQKASFITYDRIYTYNPCWNRNASIPAEYYRRRGLHFKGLTKNDTVLVKYVGGNAHVEDSAAATILFNVLSGAIVVEGKSKERGGFVGALTKFSSDEDPCILVKDSHSFVVSDLYMEGTRRNVTLSGNDGDAPGRVTIQGAKYSRGGNWSVNPAAETDNYHGELNIIMDSMCDTSHFVLKGSNPTSVLLLGDYVDPNSAIQKDSNAQFLCLGNEGTKDKTINFDCPPELKDTDFSVAAPQAARAFDDLRKLGETDLKLNHPEALK